MIRIVAICLLGGTLLFPRMADAHARLKVHARQTVIENFGGGLDRLSPEGHLLLRLINQHEVGEAELAFFQTVSQQHFNLTHRYYFGRIVEIADQFRTNYAQDLRLLFSNFQELPTDRQKHLFLMEMGADYFDLNGYDLVAMRPAWLSIRDWHPHNEFEFFVLRAARAQFGKDPYWRPYFFRDIHRVDNIHAMQAVLYLIRVVHPRLARQDGAKVALVPTLLSNLESAFRVQSEGDFNAYVDSQKILYALEGTENPRLLHQVASEAFSPYVQYLTVQQRRFVEQLVPRIQAARGFAVLGDLGRSLNRREFADFLGRMVTLVPSLDSEFHVRLLLDKALQVSEGRLHGHRGWLELIPELSTLEAYRLLETSTPPSPYRRFIDRCRRFLQSFRSAPGAR